ncbi:unnamed protein product [Closterium sp. NIES-53]
MIMTNREDLLDEVRPSEAATVVSATGQVVPVRGEGRDMFMCADGRLVGLKRVLLVPGLCANLLSTKALSEAGMKIEMMGTKVFKATLDGRVLWDLRSGKDMHQSMWEIPVLPWKEAAVRLAAEAVTGGHASHVTSGEGGDGSDGGLLVHGGGARPSVTPSMGETDWLTTHRRFGHVALPQLHQLFKEERVKGLRIKGEPKEVGSCETCDFPSIRRAHHTCSSSASSSNPRHSHYGTSSFLCSTASSLAASSASSLPDVADPESDIACAASTTVPRLLATVATDPLFESTAASALVADLSVGGECVLGTDVLEDRQENFECLATAVLHLVAMLLGPEGDPDAPFIPTSRSYAEAITGPYFSQWQTAMDQEMASWKSTGTYVNAVPPSWANIVDGMWIFVGKRPPDSPPVFNITKTLCQVWTNFDFDCLRVKKSGLNLD